MALRQGDGVVNIRPHGREPVDPNPRPRAHRRTFLRPAGFGRGNGTTRGAPRTPRRGGARRRGGEESVMSTGRIHKEQVKVHIRWMIRRDMPEVLQTEQE